MKKRKMIRRGLSVAISLLVLVMLSNIFGKHKKVTSSGAFQRALNNRLLVSLFYVEQRGISRDIREKIKVARRLLRQISKADPYKYAEVMFIGVNAAKEGLKQMAERHGVPKSTPTNPTLGLFKGGTLVATAQGFLDRDEIENLINKYFGKEINRISKEKDKERQRRLEDARRRAYNRAYWGYPYYGWGYPYYGWGWPYYRRWRGWGPSWGVGFGWRGGWGRGWRGGCRRCR